MNKKPLSVCPLCLAEPDYEWVDDEESEGICKWYCPTKTCSLNDAHFTANEWDLIGCSPAHRDSVNAANFQQAYSLLCDMRDNIQEPQYRHARFVEQCLKDAITALEKIVLSSKSPAENLINEIEAGINAFSRSQRHDRESAIDLITNIAVSLAGFRLGKTSMKTVRHETKNVVGYISEPADMKWENPPGTPEAKIDNEDFKKKRVTLSGLPPAEGSEHIGAPQPVDPATGMHKDYWVLPEEERQKGFVRPYRDRYTHTKCGIVTTMGRALSETYARDPKFYGATFCCGCRTHFPVAEFTWTKDGEIVGS